MRFRETAKIHTVMCGGTIQFQRGVGYVITRANGTSVILSSKELKAMSEMDFVTNVLELDPTAVTVLETEDRRTPPRFKPGSKERAAEVEARRERARLRGVRKTAEVTLSNTAFSNPAVSTDHNSESAVTV